MIKYVVFDFDGTLADTFEVTKRIVEKRVGAISADDIELLRNEGAKKALKKKNIPLWKVPAMALEVTSSLRKEKDIKIFPKVPELLKVISKSYKLGIVSSNCSENIEDILKKHELAGLFRFIYSQSSIFGKHFVLQKMLVKYNIKPFEAVYVGDEDRDIIAAKKAGIKSIAVTWGYNSQKRLKTVGPDHIVGSPGQIIKKLDRGV
jgi:phosphoglycolate phosphatase